MCSLDCPVNKEHLINSVAVLMKKSNKENPFIMNDQVITDTKISFVDISSKREFFIKEK